MEIIQCLKKNRTATMYRYNFTSSQHLPIIVGTDSLIDLIQFSVDYVKKFLNRLRTSCAVSITTVAT